MAETCRFTAELWRSGEPPEGWHFVTLDEATSAAVRERPRPPRGFGSVRVEVTIGSTTWRTSVFPDSGSGRYVLPVKQTVRQTEGLLEGDLLDIRLTILE
jgi:hypothetical protein